MSFLLQPEKVCVGRRGLFGGSSALPLVALLTSRDEVFAVIRATLDDGNNVIDHQHDHIALSTAVSASELVPSEDGESLFFANSLSDN